MGICWTVNVYRRRAGRRAWTREEEYGVTWQDSFLEVESAYRYSLGLIHAKRARSGHFEGRLSDLNRQGSRGRCDGHVQAGEGITRQAVRVGRARYRLPLFITMRQIPGKIMRAYGASLFRFLQSPSSDGRKPADLRIGGNARGATVAAGGCGRAAPGLRIAVAICGDHQVGPGLVSEAGWAIRLPWQDKTGAPIQRTGSAPSGKSSFRQPGEPHGAFRFSWLAVGLSRGAQRRYGWRWQRCLPHKLSR